MFFGTTTFAQAPFSDVGSSIVSPIVILSGNGLNISIGNITTLPEQLIGVTGQQFSVATNPVSVITWTPVPPGANQVWVPIDPDA
jgi:hypothetical protein|tara:strand:- start:954 stop:1208 length:255 start_codon:yes stop_codon:yes gene_type:complete